MIANLLGKDEVNAALAVALTGTIAVLVAKGNAPISSARLLSVALSNPIPRSGPAHPLRPYYGDAALDVAA